jgi:hypothetical protein
MRLNNAKSVEAQDVSNTIDFFSRLPLEVGADNVNDKFNNLRNEIVY